MPGIEELHVELLPDPETPFVVIGDEVAKGLFHVLCIVEGGINLHVRSLLLLDDLGDELGVLLLKVGAVVEHKGGELLRRRSGVDISVKTLLNQGWKIATMVEMSMG